MMRGRGGVRPPGRPGERQDDRGRGIVIPAKAAIHNHDASEGTARRPYGFPPWRA